MSTYQSPRRRYHRIDGWRGYYIPALAIAGSSDTGNWNDSPCPSGLVKQEIRRLQSEVLIPNGIKSRTRFGGSSNVFCGKRWLTVSKQDFHQAALLVSEWLEQHKFDTAFVHDADLDQLGY